MMLKLLKSIGIKHVAVAGADGYSKDKASYYRSFIETESVKDQSYNVNVATAIKKIGVDVSFLTRSIYEDLM